MREMLISLRAMTLSGLFPVVAALLLSGHVAAQEVVAESPPELVLGTWVKTGVNIDGQRIQQRIVIESKGSDGQFGLKYSETVSGTKETFLNEGEGVLTSGGPKYVVMNVARTRILTPKDKATDWKDSDFSIVAEVIADRMYSTMGLDRKGGVWTRENTTTPIVNADRMNVIAPMIGTYAGNHEDRGSNGYGIRMGTQQIVTKHWLSPSGKILIGEWTSTPAGGTADDAFEVRAVCSYSPVEKTIIVNYHTSTGVSMFGKLIRANESKLLWERTGNSPAGLIHEYCLFDFSEPGVLRHTITSRTVDGIAEEAEQGVVITLKKQN